jgi:hypothetical protein
MSIQTVIDSKNRLINQAISGNDNKNEQVICKIREFVKSEYLKSGYLGFSDDFDRQFDNLSTYFYVMKQGNQADIVASQRVIIKSSGNLLPLEKAHICGANPAERFQIKENNVAEITSFAFRGAKALALLYSSVAYYGKKQGIKKAYALLDLEEDPLSKIYAKIGWVTSKIYAAPIFFSDYGRKINGKFTPTLWRVLELDEQTMTRIVNKYNKYNVVSG